MKSSSGGLIKMGHIPQVRDNWQYNKMCKAEQENIDAEGIYESLGLTRAPNRMAAILTKMERDDARKMPAIFGSSGREAQAFEALQRMEVA